jgi:hypothetical protein
LCFLEILKRFLGKVFRTLMKMIALGWGQQHSVVVVVVVVALTL